MNRHEQISAQHVVLENVHASSIYHTHACTLILQKGFLYAHRTGFFPIDIGDDIPFFLHIDGSLVKPSSMQADKSKTIFTKYVDSVLAKCAKIRTLIGDLKKNYDDPLATGYLERIFSANFLKHFCQNQYFVFVTVSGPYMGPVWVFGTKLPFPTFSQRSKFQKSPFSIKVSPGLGKGSHFARCRVQHVE